MEGNTPAGSVESAPGMRDGHAQPVPANGEEQPSMPSPVSMSISAQGSTSTAVEETHTPGDTITAPHTTEGEQQQQTAQTAAARTVVHDSNGHPHLDNGGAPHGSFGHGAESQHGQDSSGFGHTAKADSPATAAETVVGDADSSHASAALPAPSATGHGVPSGLQEEEVPGRKKPRRRRFESSPPKDLGKGMYVWRAHTRAHMHIRAHTHAAHPVTHGHVHMHEPSRVRASTRPSKS